MWQAVAARSKQGQEGHTEDQAREPTQAFLLNSPHLEREELEHELWLVRRRSAGLEREIKLLEEETTAANAQVENQRPLGAMVSNAEMKRLDRQITNERTMLVQRQKELAQLLSDDRTRLTLVVEDGVQQYFGEMRERQLSMKPQYTAPSADIEALAQQRDLWRRQLSEAKQELGRLTRELEVVRTECEDYRIRVNSLDSKT
mmetsp:Transcript_24321/g.53121  ORF Transcript_24321/g.53121 Transcript_24321/m.53121 type:complete len:202 (+) Transcript_24321:198-803(+)|eukprot:6187436-Pleurochrysis_carterae.AAC.2